MRNEWRQDLPPEKCLHGTAAAPWRRQNSQDTDPWRSSLKNLQPRHQSCPWHMGLGGASSEVQIPKVKFPRGTISAPDVSRLGDSVVAPWRCGDTFTWRSSPQLSSFISKSSPAWILPEFSHPKHWDQLTWPLQLTTSSSAFLHLGKLSSERNSPLSQRNWAPPPFPRALGKAGQDLCKPPAAPKTRAGLMMAD